MIVLYLMQWYKIISNLLRRKWTEWETRMYYKTVVGVPAISGESIVCDHSWCAHRTSQQFDTLALRHQPRTEQDLNNWTDTATYRSIPLHGPMDGVCRPSPITETQFCKLIRNLMRSSTRRGHIDSFTSWYLRSDCSPHSPLFPSKTCGGGVGGGWKGREVMGGDGRLPDEE